MTPTWTDAQLALIGAADELEIAVRRVDGNLGRWTPIWAVRHGEGVYVRTWERRDTGWYGAVLLTRQARVRVGGLEADVAVEDVGPVGDVALRADVDGAYREKYGRYGATTVDRMVSDDAAGSTLKLSPSSRS